MKDRTLIAFLLAAAVLVGGCSKRSEPVAIEPGVAVGSVHSGMTIQQVIAELERFNKSYSHMRQTNRGHLGELPWLELGRWR
jgi:hypothetical protein